MITDSIKEQDVILKPFKMNSINSFISTPTFKHLVEIKNSWNIENYLPFYNETIGNFKNKIVIITGASSGIGKASALEFVNQGATVILASRNTQKLNSLSKEFNKINANYLIVKTDVRSKKECKNLIDTTISTFGKIDILVNNAGISMRANFALLKLEVLEELIQTNFWGTVYCTKYAMPYLLKSKGSIVGVSSITGLTPLPGRTGYAASKHAMNGFLNSLRIENLKTGLHVMIIHPGFTSSNIRNAALNESGEQQSETPRDEQKMMSSETVAKILVKGVKTRSGNITLTTEGKLIVWFYKRFPKFTEKIIYSQMSKEVNSPF